MKAPPVLSASIWHAWRRHLAQRSVQRTKDRVNFKSPSQSVDRVTVINCPLIHFAGFWNVAEIHLGRWKWTEEQDNTTAHMLQMLKKRESINSSICCTLFVLHWGSWGSAGACPVIESKRGDILDKLLVQSGATQAERQRHTYTHTFRKIWQIRVPTSPQIHVQEPMQDTERTWEAHIERRKARHRTNNLLVVCAKHCNPPESLSTFHHTP